MEASPPTSIDEFISNYRAEVQEVLQKIRSIIKEEYPEAGEKISYGIPTMTTTDGKYLMYFAAFPKHVSVYPIPEGDVAFQEKIAFYKAGKGTIHFSLAKPIPYDIIREVAKQHVKRVSASQL